MTGKSSLFTILTGAHEPGRIGSLEARRGVARVPDARVDTLAEVFQTPKLTHATIDLLDFPAVSRETLRDPGYLASLRLVDSMAHVLRVFEDDTVPHEKITVDPLRDLEDVELELMLSDLGMIEKRLEKLEKDRKKIKNPELDQEFELLEQCKARLEENAPLRTLELTGEDEKRLRGYQFLSQKPLLCVLNLGEEQAPRLHQIEREYKEGPLAGRPGINVVAICGKIEAELAELAPEEAPEYLSTYGLPESGMERLVTAAYSLLGLITFLTVGENEARAWPVPVGTSALKAAGSIHTDFEQRFIRAEVIGWKSLAECGSYALAREKGLLRLEGKEYVVNDGDVLLIRHG